jgi:hypothetical protein
MIMNTKKSDKGEIVPQTINRENIELYVEMFNLWGRKSAEAVLGLARTLVEAENELSKGEFAIFCEEVGITKGSPSYKKLHVIGERVDRLLPVSQSLPDNWTTIYLLASLKQEDFESIREAKLIKPTLKALEIKERIPTPPRARRGKQGVPKEVMLDFRNIEKEQLQDIFKTIEKWKEDVGLGVQWYR